MSRHDSCQCCENNENSSGGFFLGLILGLMIGAVIAILIYRHNKSEVVQVLRKKINKFILDLENKTKQKTRPRQKIHSKTVKSPPKTFLVK